MHPHVHACVYCILVKHAGCFCGFGLFLWPNVLPRIIKITELPKITNNESQKNDYQFELLKVRKMTSLKIYIFPVMEKLETNLDSR